MFEQEESEAYLKKLLTQANTYSASSLSDSTKRAYASDWEDFHSWARRVRRVPLPASEETVSLYVVSLLEEGLKVGTCQRRVAAITSHHKDAGHRLPVEGAIRDVMRGAKREKGTRSEGKAALTPEQLRAMCQALNRERSTAARTRRSARDRALLTLGFAAALRASEISGLDLSDVHFVRKGLLVTIRWSKTDQEGEGREVGVFAGKRASSDPVRALKAWLKFRGRKPGALFPGGYGLTERLTRTSVNLIVKRAIERIGCDAGPYGSHSLRAGFVTAAAEAGMSETLIMQTTGHRSYQTLSRYVRPAKLFGVNALAKAL